MSDLAVLMFTASWKIVKLWVGSDGYSGQPCFCLERLHERKKRSVSECAGCSDLVTLFASDIGAFLLTPRLITINTFKNILRADRWWVYFKLLVLDAYFS